jgi:RNA polymerase sigma-70 factor (ECF subfamily)
MAFLVLLERLTPVERAVFLLREVFEYEYAELAAVLGESEANCRQILHRAKQHVAKLRPRFQTSQREKSELLGRFLTATRNGDLQGLISLLANDVVLYTDGGGKTPSALNPIHGADKVARGALGAIARLLPQNLTVRVAEINGDPGIVSYVDGKPYSVLTLDTSDGRIVAIYAVANPDKLAHVAELSAN